MSAEAFAWAFASDVKMTRKLVLLALARFAGPDGRCQPSVKVLAACTGLSDRAVQLCIRDLEASGHIAVDRRGDSPSRYRLKVDLDILDDASREQLVAEFFDETSVNLMHQKIYGAGCSYCDATQVPLECDHVILRAKGGQNDRSNLTVACDVCNRDKGSKMLSEWVRA